jgi:hypothetical protein
MLRLNSVKTRASNTMRCAPADTCFNILLRPSSCHVPVMVGDPNHEILARAPARACAGIGSHAAVLRARRGGAPCRDMHQHVHLRLHGQVEERPYANYKEHACAKSLGITQETYICIYSYIYIFRLV